MNVASDRLPLPDYAPGLTGLAERGLLPDTLLRLGIRRQCEQRLREELAGGQQVQSQRFAARIAGLASSAVALHVDSANRQHYEVPAEFFHRCLGKRLKYSSCYYATGTETLDEAEEAMLALYGERAQLADGQHILELGCGWGSLTLWMAERYPNAQITAVSNSNSQREYILGQCRERGLITRCSSTCATPRSCCSASTAGCGRRASCSCIFSCTAR